MMACAFHKKTAELCRKLIQAQSCSGQEAEAGKILADAFREMGYDEVTIDGYGNVLGCIHGKKPGPCVLFDGHIDTVPVDDPAQWTVEPFAGTVKDDKIYGRGASDMKGAVAAMACAVAKYADDCGRDFPGVLYVAGVVYEELFEGVSARMISEAVQPDYVVIGEASELNLKIGQRGRAEIVLETFGKPAHSANPEKGINAVRMMMRLLDQVDRLQPPEQAGLGRGILEVTDIISEPFPGASVVPSHCIATLDRRLLVGETPESVLMPLERMIAQLGQEDEKFHGRVSLRGAELSCYTGRQISAKRFFPGWKFDEHAEFIRRSREALCQAGLNPTVTNYSFCTNGSHYAGEKQIPTIGFGPSFENLAHTVDEYITLEQLYHAADGYVNLAGALTSCPVEKVQK